MGDRLLIYGASGYTGELIARQAAALGLEPILAGRREAAVAPLAETLGVDCRTGPLGDAAALRRMLDGVAAVLNAAGPFARTAPPLVDACLDARAHYLDITGEIPVIESLRARHAAACARGVMLMPGVGFDVVPSDGLALHVARRLAAPVRLSLALMPLSFATRGSMKTFLEHADDPVWVRRGGRLTGVAPGSLRGEFPFAGGSRAAVAVNWGDVATAYYSTGIPEIAVFFASTAPLEATLTASRYFGRLLASAPGKAWIGAHLDMLPPGPTAEEREAGRTEIVASVEDASGRRATSRLFAPEAYAFTAMSAPCLARRVIEGDLQPGFQTPARVYGPDFALSLPGVVREDLPIASGVGMPSPRTEGRA